MSTTEGDPDQLDELTDAQLDAIVVTSRALFALPESPQTTMEP